MFILLQCIPGMLVLIDAAVCVILALPVRQEQMANCFQAQSRDFGVGHIHAYEIWVINSQLCIVILFLAVLIRLIWSRVESLCHTKLDNC